jgi:hypothetical protein
LDHALADGATDEPAQVAGSKLPDHAFLPDIRGTVPLLPAWLLNDYGTTFETKEKE